jgi:glycerol uptake facilitator-like aquaporin
VFGGLSVVIVMSGAGSPLAGITPSGAWGRLITGFLFGTTGAIIAISPVGKVSGAHINPVVTLGFWLMHKIDTRTALGFVVAQLAGASAGALPISMFQRGSRNTAFRVQHKTWTGMEPPNSPPQRSGALAELLKRDFQRTKFLHAQFRYNTLFICPECF